MVCLGLRIFHYKTNNFLSIGTDAGVHEEARKNGKAIKHNSLQANHIYCFIKNSSNQFTFLSIPRASKWNSCAILQGECIFSILYHRSGQNVSNPVNLRFDWILESNYHISMGISIFCCSYASRESYLFS